MAFYGNLNNTTRSQFYFDKIYPNRKVMDESASSDQVFLGRYVLVEYNSELSEDFFQSDFYYKDGKLYSSVNLEPSSLITTKNSTLKNGDIIRIEPGKNKNTQNKVSEFHMIVVKGTNITSEKIINEDQKNAFFLNYNIDLEAYFNSKLSQDYPKGRGYDSTVWQKVYDNKEEKYVMVAELNTNPPIMDIVTDAPTISPLTPHFDPDSTNSHYRLHVQPTWGLWPRAANIGNATTQTEVYKSDVNVDYEVHTYDPETDTIEKTTSTNIPAAIYFNRAGFNKETRGYDAESSNFINILPTGKSGAKYYDHESGEMRVAPDINELTMQLPAIGNAVSDLWDLMYGETRNLDIEWDSQKGLRFITSDANGGYNFNYDNIQTLAGTINSVHDLMGMIIKEVSITDFNDSEAIDQLESGYIYYNKLDKKFYRKTVDYTYDETGVIWRTANGGPYYAETNVTADNYLSNTYYIDKNGEKVPDTENAFQAGVTYYTKQIEPGAKIPISLITDYEPNKYYYYRAIDKALYLSTADTYYQGYEYKVVTEKNAEPIKLSPEYYSRRYYLLNNGNYIQATSETPEYAYNLYYDFQTENMQEEVMYIPDYFYYIDNKGNIFIESATTFDKNKQYYTIRIGDDLKITLEQIKLLEYKANTYYLRDDEGNYTLITHPVAQLKDFATPPKIYCPEFKQLEYDFYQPDKYWYKVDRDYFKAIDNYWDSQKRYYDLAIADIVAFYEPNKFWYFNERYQMWMIDEALKMSQPGDKYYYTNTYYVISDGLQIVNEGAEWNGNIAIIPHPVIIGTRKEIKVLKELKDFSKSYNTLHGLILQLNDKIEDENYRTRDISTLQGCLNFINDHIDKISELYPKEFVVVDNYGRMHSANLHTDNYINIEINPNVKRPEIFTSLSLNNLTNDEIFTYPNSDQKVSLQWLINKIAELETR